MSGGRNEQENVAGVKCVHVGYNIGEKRSENMEYMGEVVGEGGGGP